MTTATTRVNSVEQAAIHDKDPLVDIGRTHAIVSVVCSRDAMFHEKSRRDRNLSGYRFAGPERPVTGLVWSLGDIMKRMATDR